MCWMKKTTNAISDTVRKESLQVALLQIRSTVETVHLCCCFAEVWSEFHRCISARCVQRDWPGFLVSLKLLSWWAICKIFLCQLVHLDALLLSPISFELRITISQIFLKEIVNSFTTLFDTSLPRIMGFEVLLLCCSFTMPSTMRSPPSWWHSSGLREHPIAIGEDVGWIHFLSRDVHKCNKLFLGSSKEGILCIAL